MYNLIIMLQIFRKLNKEKGASIIELMAVVAMASIVISGVSVKVGDLLNEAKDTQRIANLRQLATALELYYSDYQNYPRVNGNSSQERWDELISKIEVYLASFPTGKENYDYQALNNGQNYVLKVFLENSKSPFLEADWDGIIGDLDCQDPNYCLKM